MDGGKGEMLTWEQGSVSVSVGRREEGELNAKPFGKA